MPRKSKSEYWEKMVSEWEQNGLTQQRFCEENLINTNTFRFWKNKLKLEKGFVELPVISARRTPIEIYLEDKKITIRVIESFDNNTLLKIFKSLGV